MSSFLKSRRNRILIVILSSLLIPLLFQTGISYILNKSKPRILGYLNNTFEYRFALGNISFNFLQGLHIKQASVFYNNQGKPTIFIKEAFIHIKILPLIFKRTIAIQADINQAQFLLNKEEKGLNLQMIFSDIYKKMPKIKPLILNKFKDRLDISIKFAKLIYTGNTSFQNYIYILIKNSKFKQESERFRFDSDIELNYQLSEDAYIARFFKNKSIKQEINCSIQGNIKGKDLIMDLILLNIGKNQIIGTGTTKDFRERNPYVDIAFMHSVILLDNITSMKDNFAAEGNAFFSLKINGPMNNTKASIVGTLLDCNLRYALANAESFDIKNFNGELDYGDTRIKLDKVYLKLNTVPLNIKLLINISDEPDIALSISLLREFLTAQNLPLARLEAVFNGKIKKTLQGELKLDALYIRRGLKLNMQAYFKNIDFDYSSREEKYFRAGVIELIKDNTLKIQKLSFTNFKSKVYLGKDRIELKELNFYGYNALLNGKINLNVGDKTALIFTLEGIGLDVKTLMQDINISNKLLSGSMDTKVMFDNQQKGFLEGECYIKDGVADLDLVANILKLPSLKKVNFDLLESHFSLSKETVRVNEIKLVSPDVMLNTSWDTNGKIDGILNLKIASGLLNQSKAFKRLLALTEIKKPYIDFSFLLGGVPDSVRVMWMKGEFKDKIKEGLPDWAKKRIENNLDKLIDGMANE